MKNMFYNICYSNDNLVYRTTFALTVPVLHHIRTAFGSFFQKVRKTYHNTPSMPLNDAHLGGLFFLGV